MIDWSQVETAEDKLAEVLAADVQAERRWRDAELARADIGLAKTQDGVGTGTVAEWRAYRISLRAWPKCPDFPNEDCRPPAPDVK